MGKETVKQFQNVQRAPYRIAEEKHGKAHVDQTNNISTQRNKILKGAREKKYAREKKKAYTRESP